MSHGPLREEASVATPTDPIEASRSRDLHQAGQAPDPPWRPELIEPLYAGYLCATHVDSYARIQGRVGRIQAIIYTRERSTVRVIHQERDGYRPDGSVRWKTHCLALDPRTVVEIIES